MIINVILNLSYPLGGREKNIKILWIVGFASSLTKLWISVCLWGFGNVLAKYSITCNNNNLIQGKHHLEHILKSHQLVSPL